MQFKVVSAFSRTNSSLGWTRWFRGVSRWVAQAFTHVHWGALLALPACTPLPPMTLRYEVDGSLVVTCEGERVPVVTPVGLRRVDVACVLEVR